MSLQDFSVPEKQVCCSNLHADFMTEKKKIVVIENEISRDGVDGDRLRNAGLEVRELYAGCICCNLSGDMLTTMIQLKEQHAPDVVLIEPSGIAGPEQIASTFEGWQKELHDFKIAVVLDAARFRRLTITMPPFLSGSLQTADIIVVNKCDLINDAGKLIREIQSYCTGNDNDYK